MFEMLSKIDSICGTPFYLSYPKRFEDNLKSFRKAFVDIYPKFILSYSFKTNYTPPLLQLVKACGCFAETVSSMEYNMAVQLGFDGKSIIFNGPVKSYGDIKNAVQNNSLVQLDGEYEVAYVLALRKEHPDKDICIGLRINMEINTDAGKSAIQAGLKESRFGFTRDILDRIIPLLKSNGVKIRSLHGHTSSTNRVVENYQLIATRLLEICQTYALDDVEYLDLGGGFFGAAPQEIDVSKKPSYSDYAEGICQTLLSNGWFREHSPFIVIEPGTSVVANVFELVTKIYQKKNVRGKNFVIVDASCSQVRPSRGSTNYPFLVYSPNVGEPEIMADIVGSTCMEVDKISSEVNMNHYSYGDYIVYKGVGAYRHNMTPFFINPRCPIVKIENGNVVILRERQTAAEMMRLLGYKE